MCRLYTKMASGGGAAGTGPSDKINTEAFSCTGRSRTLRQQSSTVYAVLTALCGCRLAVVGRGPLAVLWEISQLLNTGLDRESLFLCIQLLEQNVNPEALAAVVKELKREARAIQVRHPRQLA